jgi:hypothetical protein
MTPTVQWTCPSLSIVVRVIRDPEEDPRSPNALEEDPRRPEKALRRPNALEEDPKSREESPRDPRSTKTISMQDLPTVGKRCSLHV